MENEVLTDRELAIRLLAEALGVTRPMAEAHFDAQRQRFPAPIIIFAGEVSPPVVRYAIHVIEEQADEPTALETQVAPRDLAPGEMLQSADLADLPGITSANDIPASALSPDTALDLSALEGSTAVAAESAEPPRPSASSAVNSIDPAP